MRNIFLWKSRILTRFRSFFNSKSELKSINFGIHELYFGFDTSISSIRFFFVVTSNSATRCRPYRLEILTELAHCRTGNKIFLQHTLPRPLRVWCTTQTTRVEIRVSPRLGTIKTIIKAIGKVTLTWVNSCTICLSSSYNKTYSWHVVRECIARTGWWGWW